MIRIERDGKPADLAGLRYVFLDAEGNVLREGSLEGLPSSVEGTVTVVRIDDDQATSVRTVRVSR